MVQYAVLFVHLLDEHAGVSDFLSFLGPAGGGQLDDRLLPHAGVQEHLLARQHFNVG